MLRHISKLIREGDPVFRKRLLALAALLIAANVGVWIAALALLRETPALLGAALLAYSFGLRHAVDADHIAAIDNVTRKLMQKGDRPIGVGLWFSLGHAAIVTVLSLVVAGASGAMTSGFKATQAAAAVISAGVSAGFLFAIAAVNIVVLVAIYRTFRAVRRGAPYVESDFDLLLNDRGLLSRLFRPLFALVTKSWHMFAIGALFGVGFDTASEIALFGISATQAASHAPVGALLIFPALFAAGMALIDAIDGVMMLGAYGWAFMDPMRKLYYNMTITATSVAVAVIVGGLETLNLIGDQLGWSAGDGFFGAVGAVNGRFGLLGYIIIATFTLAWIGSVAAYRWLGYDKLEAPAK
jgi:nickel/cobalt transporter (NiCoT) family protein